MKASLSSIIDRRWRKEEYRCRRTRRLILRSTKDAGTGNAIVASDAEHRAPRKRQNTFHISSVGQTCLSDDILIGIRFIVNEAVKKAGRRQLSLVANNRHMFAPQDGAEGVLGLDLASLVDNEQIKLSGTWRQKLRNREGTHEHYGFDFLNNRAGPGHELSDWQVTTLSGYLSAHDTHLTNRATRHSTTMAIQDLAHGKFATLRFEGLKLTRRAACEPLLRSGQEFGI